MRGGAGRDPRGAPLYRVAGSFAEAFGRWHGRSSTATSKRFNTHARARARAQPLNARANPQAQANDATPCWGRASQPPRQVLSELTEQCGLGEHRAEQLYFSLKALGAAVGTCDKLLRYPIPLA
jgi:hypothetical protein